MATVKENLIAARALIEDQRSWSRGLDGPGMCAIMALEKAMGLDRRCAYSTQEYTALNDALPAEWIKSNGRGSVGFFNDERGHLATLALFDRAIAAA